MGKKCTPSPRLPCNNQFMPPTSTHLSTRHATTSFGLSYFVSSTTSLPSAAVVATISGKQAHQPISAQNINKARQYHTEHKQSIETSHSTARTSQIFQKPLNANLITGLSPKLMMDPLSKNYDRDTRCTYYMDTPEHGTESCKALRHKVQDLIENETLAVSPLFS